MDITLLEIQLPDAEFNAPFAGGSRDEDDVERSSTAAAVADGPSVRGPVIALLVLLGLALLARYLRGNGSDADDPAA